MKPQTNKKALIIYVHPYNKSFAHAELEQAQKALQYRKKKYQVIDLYKDKFDPVFHANELAQYSKGTTNNPQVIKYQKMLSESDELIFIYPIWWGTRPAILQGFFDKVFLVGHTWENKVLPILKIKILWGKMTWIKKVHIFTTGAVPNLVAKWYLGNSLKTSMVQATLKTLRVKKIKWTYVGKISNRSNENRKKILNKVYKKLSK